MGISWLAYLFPDTAGGETSGDVSGTLPGPLTVGKINGAVVPAAGALPNSVVLQTTGAAQLSYGFIANANVDVAAAVAGTKISPNFGAQTIETTGAVQGFSGLTFGRTAASPTISQTRPTSDVAPADLVVSSQAPCSGASVYHHCGNIIFWLPTATDPATHQGRVAVQFGSGRTETLSVTDSTIEFGSTVVSPSIAVAGVSATGLTGETLSISAQDCGGSGSVGGSLRLDSGSGGVGGHDGDVSIGLGGSDYIKIGGEAHVVEVGKETTSELSVRLNGKESEGIYNIDINGTERCIPIASVPASGDVPYGLIRGSITTADTSMHEIGLYTFTNEPPSLRVAGFRVLGVCGYGRIGQATGYAAGDATSATMGSGPVLVTTGMNLTVAGASAVLQITAEATDSVKWAWDIDYMVLPGSTFGPQ